MLRVLASVLCASFLATACIGDILSDIFGPDTPYTPTPTPPEEALSPGWAEPFIFPASEDDIIVFGAWDIRGNRPGGRVDHVGGLTEREAPTEGIVASAAQVEFDGSTQNWAIIGPRFNKNAQ